MVRAAQRILRGSTSRGARAMGPVLFFIGGSIHTSIGSAEVGSSMRGAERFDRRISFFVADTPASISLKICPSGIADSKFFIAPSQILDGYWAAQRAHPSCGVQAPDTRRHYACISLRSVIRLRYLYSHMNERHIRKSAGSSVLQCGASESRLGSELL